MKKFLSLEVSYQFVCYHCEKRSESEQPNQVRRFITDGLGVGLVEDSRSRGGGNDCVATCNRLGSLSGGVFVACDVATADFEPNPRSRVSARGVSGLHERNYWLDNHFQRVEVEGNRTRQAVSVSRQRKARVRCLCDYCLVRGCGHVSLCVARRWQQQYCQHRNCVSDTFHRPNSFWTLKLGQALLANSLCPCTVAPGYLARSSATSLTSADFCASVRVSLGVLPSLAQPPI